MVDLIRLSARFYAYFLAFSGFKISAGPELLALCKQPPVFVLCA
jgi:hypothetical protein